METVKFCGVNFRDKVCITDKNVYELYQRQFNDKNTFVIPSGEQSKNLATIELICKFFLDKNITRTDTVYAVGGGVVGDIVGFACSIFKRGIKFINVPTTLLSMVDSSVGGKNGVDFCGIKNVLGQFYLPEVVYIDFNYLKTLPSAEYLNGIAEVFKYSLIEDFAFDGDITQVIPKCIKLKQKIVESDFFDLGRRLVLNVGHTLGHAIEMSYGLPHGQAILNGIFYETKISYFKGLCNKALLRKIQDKCLEIGAIIEIEPNEIFLQCLVNDKKNKDGKICFMLVKDIGDIVESYLTLDDIKELLLR